MARRLYDHGMNPTLWRQERIRRAMPRLSAQNRTNLIEMDPKRRWIAFSRFDEVVTLISNTWFRTDPWTNTIGPKLPKLELVELYDKENDDWFHKQRFRLLMFGIAPANSAVGDAVRIVWQRHKWFNGGWLYTEQAEQREVQRRLALTVQEYWSEGRALKEGLFKPYTFHVGMPVEGDTFGKGRIIERHERELEVRLNRQKGGISVPEIRPQSVPVQIQDRRGRRP